MDDVQQSQNEFKLVSNKRKRNRRSTNVILEASNTEDLKGVAPQHHLHVYRLARDTSCEDIKNYLQAKNLKINKCEKLQSKYPNEYASFKLSVPENEAAKITNPDLWPVGVRINRFFHWISRKEGMR